MIWIAEGRNRGTGDIANKDRLEPRGPATDQGQNRCQGGHRCKPIEEVILWTKDDRGAKDNGRRDQGLDRGLTGRLGAGIFADTLLIGADGRDLDHLADACRHTGLSDGLWAHGLQALETLTAALVEHPDRIDTGLSPFERAGHRRGHANIGLHDLDLTDIAEHP